MYDEGQSEYRLRPNSAQIVRVLLSGREILLVEWTPLVGLTRCYSGNMQPVMDLPMRVAIAEDLAYRWAAYLSAMEE
jgi:3-polyprenyl-4-hydroxybenzoate decarboxylase